MKPLQLVKATNDEIPCETFVKHLTPTCFFLKKLSDKCFFYSFPNANLRQVKSKPDLEDEQLQALYNDFFLWSYKYGYNRLQKNHAKRWKIFEDFRNYYIDWHPK